MAMPAPLAAPNTPLYSPPTVVPSDARSRRGGRTDGAGGSSCAILDSPTGGGAFRAATTPACSRTLSVSSGWMVDCDAARASAPANTSVAGFSGTLAGGVAATAAAVAAAAAPWRESWMATPAPFAGMRRRLRDSRGRGTHASGLGSGKRPGTSGRLRLSPRRRSCASAMATEASSRVVGRMGRRLSRGCQT
eukprot:360210-Chlamydomonas_euryale.AAC.18